jgi:hypothetical protein
MNGVSNPRHLGEELGNESMILETKLQLGFVKSSLPADAVRQAMANYLEPAKTENPM